jgi:hypothetical protein
MIVGERPICKYGNHEPVAILNSENPRLSDRLLF